MTEGHYSSQNIIKKIHISQFYYSMSLLSYLAAEERWESVSRNELKESWMR